VPHSRLRGRNLPSQRRKTAWDVANFGRVDGLAADGSSLFTTAFNVITGGITMVRLRGEIVIASSMTSGDSADLAVGIGISTIEAVTAGVASLPSPIVDADWSGWMHHQFCSVSAITQSVTQQSQNYRFEVDSKAQRKTPLGQTIFAVVEMDNEQGTGVTVDLICNCRLLLLLP